MSRLTLAMVVGLVALLALSGTAVGTPVEADFEAELTGAEEVPPVATATTGEARFDVNEAETAIRYELEIQQATNILGAAGAHIHCAPAGQNGPVVVFLAGALPGGLDGQVEIKATLTQANIVNDSCGATIAELVDSMEAANTYVNAHSPAHPGGEVRGQIEEV